MHLRILSILALLSLAQCNKNAAPSPSQTSSGLTLVTEGISPHFPAVASKLEIGGASFTYVEEDDVMGLLGGFFEEVIKSMPEKEKSKLPPNFSFRKMMSMIGLDSIKASGTSSRKVSEGVNHHRSFAYTPLGRKGLLALTGGPAEPLLVPALATKDADLAFEFPLHLKDWVAETWPMMMDNIPVEQRPMIEAMASAPQPMLGMSYREAAEKLSVRVAVIATMMPEQSISAPGSPMTFPGVNAAIVVDKLGWIKEVIKLQVLPMFQGPESPIELQINNGVWTGRFRAPMGPPPMDFQPMFQMDEAADRLIIVTRPGYLDQMMAADGKLSSQPEFASIWKGLPKEGNGCLYVSKRMMEATMDAMKTGVAASGSDKESREMVLNLVNLISKHARHPQAVCYANLPDGILTASNTSLPTMNPGSFSSITTLAVLSSLAVPAFSTVQQSSTRVKTFNNGRQVLTALKTYAADHDGKYPAKLQELIDSGALTNPELLTVASQPGLEPMPWLYDSTLTPESPGITIVLASPEVSKGTGGKETRVVIRNDGRAEALPEADFQRVKDYYLR